MRKSIIKNLLLNPVYFTKKYRYSLIYFRWFDTEHMYSAVVARENCDEVLFYPMWIDPYDYDIQMPMNFRIYNDLECS
ncbi:hypothetical protein [Capybara microvirus Cap3_SP_541]|nr:hypothetical protein [Capybara microvirus Cap3_SP_541]